MGLCEKCDDRASGRVDCDLTSEKERDNGERKVAREWFGWGNIRGDGRD